MREIRVEQNTFVVCQVFQWSWSRQMYLDFSSPFFSLLRRPYPGLTNRQNYERVVETSKGLGCDP